MMLVYDLFYYNAKTGRRLNNFDADTRGPSKAPKGEVVQCVCKNWGASESYWVDENGNGVPADHPARGTT